MSFDRRIVLFLFLTGSFVTALVVGDIIGGKLMDVTVLGHTFTISAGMLPFPLTFLLTDLLNEFYGNRAARLVTWVGFFMAAFAFALITVAVALPWAPFTFDAGWGGMRSEAFDNIFAGSQRILIASMLAYLVAQFVDIGVFHLLKKRTQNRLLWLRATGSTVVSQMIDTIVIQVVAWYGLLPLAKIANVALSSYAVKLAVAIALTPLIYAGHALLERGLGLRPVVLGENGEPLVVEEEPSAVALGLPPGAA